MLQPLNLLLGSGVSHTVLTCTDTAFGHRVNLIPIPWAALADEQENVFARLRGMERSMGKVLKVQVSCSF